MRTGSRRPTDRIGMKLFSHTLTRSPAAGAAPASSMPVTAALPASRCSWSRRSRAGRAAPTGAAAVRGAAAGTAVGVRREAREAGMRSIVVSMVVLAREVSDGTLERQARRSRSPSDREPLQQRPQRARHLVARGGGVGRPADDKAGLLERAEDDMRERPHRL